MTQFQASFRCQSGNLTFDFRILWYTEELTLNSMTARCPGAVAAIITTPPSWWQLLWSVCSRMVCFCFAKHGAVHSGQTSTEVLQFAQMQLCKPKLCCHVLFSEKWLSAGNPLKQAILVQQTENYPTMAKKRKKWKIMIITTLLIMIW